MAGFFSISGQTGQWKPIPTTKEEPCWSGEYSPVRTEHLDTYYVYDDLNRLRYVLSSQAEEIFRQAGETRSGSDKGIADYAYEYRYNGNQLTKVTDNAASSAYNNGFEFKDGADRETEYTYDENGNLTQDLNRKIKDIQYNFLNLLQRIEFGDGSTTEYFYDADGRKLRTVHRADGKTTTTDYAGNLIYENGNPARLLTGYGYVSLPDGMYHYYPFGGMFATTDNVQPYKYNGKELDARKGFNWYDYGARHYDLAVGRWHVPDPMQEKYYNTSQYAYCMNSPIKYIAPNGCDVKPAGNAELIMIQNTLPKDARSYVRLNKNGMIDRALLNSYDGKSLNFNNLKTMVNSDRIVEVVLDDKFTFMGQDEKLGTETIPYNSFDPKYDLESDKDLKGETMGGLSTGESGFMGKTLFPDKDGIQNSPNGPHYMYILNGGNHKGASHQPINGQWIEENKTLMEMIINSKKETIENMQGT